jgi:4-diphosphocytidyl-2-C-methyl-D-erythritol kinase
MRGVGERLEPAALPAGIAVLLVNPRVPVSTADVFRALAAPPLRDGGGPDGPSARIRFDDTDDFFRLLREQANDLQAVACRLCPAIADVLDQLRGLDGVRLARMSGSGPTCFALFGSQSQAAAAAQALASRRPEWWMAAAPLA